MTNQALLLLLLLLLLLPLLLLLLLLLPLEEGDGQFSRRKTQPRETS